MADTVPQKIARVANRLLHPLGLYLSRRQAVFDMDGLLARTAVHCPNVATWIDVGASDGSWSLRAQRHYPQSAFVLFEPLAERQAALRALQEKRGFHCIPAAAAAERGEIEFSVDPALDGSGVAAAGSANTRRVPMETIDTVVATRNLPGPYGIKLDTHGYEEQVLAGATTVLANAEVLIIEAYNFTLTSGCLRFHELCAWLERRDFRCCDLADPMRRPADGTLWQMDLAFARTTHPIFTSNHYA